MEPRKKKPKSNYKQVSYRPSDADFELIEAKIDKILNHLNHNLKPDQAKVKKNDVGITALKNGLQQLEKEMGIE